MKESLARKLKTLGWVYEPFEFNLIALCNILNGNPVQSCPTAPVLQHLNMSDQLDARPLSLSAQHGAGAFPYHTDCAHHLVTPRYVCMRLVRSEGTCRPTLLKDVVPALTSECVETLFHETWIVNNGRGAFLAPLLERQASGLAIRYDEGCMRPGSPRNNRGRMLLHEALSSLETIEIHWRYGWVLVIDNHRFLHARASTPLAGRESVRTLERLLIMSRAL